jgi:hypothetical protein
MVMKELLFSIISGIVLGTLLTAAGGAALDFFMVRQLGMSCKYFYPDVIIKILSAYVLLLGLLQLPIRYALFRISTVDAIDDDL